MFWVTYRASEAPALKWYAAPTVVQTLLLQRQTIHRGNNPAALPRGSSTFTLSLSHGSDSHMLTLHIILASHSTEVRKTGQEAQAELGLLMRAKCTIWAILIKNSKYNFWHILFKAYFGHTSPLCLHHCKMHLNSELGAPPYAKGMHKVSLWKMTSTRECPKMKSLLQLTLQISFLKDSALACFSGPWQNSHSENSIYASGVEIWGWKVKSVFGTVTRITADEQSLRGTVPTPEGQRTRMDNTRWVPEMPFGTFPFNPLHNLREKSKLSGIKTGICGTILQGLYLLET